MSARRAAKLAISAAVIYAVLALPNHPNLMAWQALARVPLELPVLLGAMLVLAPYRRAAALVATVLTLCLMLTAAMKLADLAMFTAYQRPFNPMVDMSLASAGVNLATNTFGNLAGYGFLVAFGSAFAGLALAIWLSLMCWAKVSLPAVGRAVGGGVAVLFAAVTIADVGHRQSYWTLAQDPPGSSYTTWLSHRRLLMVQDTAAHLADFRAQARQDPYAHASGLFVLIGDRDVLIVFIESYGRASFDHPPYAATHLPILTSAERTLAEAGLAMRSGWLKSPTAGGQSWLAHGAFASGLWTHDNGTYRAMLKSDRKSLFHLAQEAGFRTNVVMPAITMDWPEVNHMEFEQVVTADGLGYAGAPFNWVTMPDQYTLSAYAPVLGTDARRDFTQIALISSHAPWVPVAPILPWDDIGDGSVFTPHAEAGPTPREVWQDRDWIRDQYRLSVAYSLEVTFDHIARIADEEPLVIVLGDHQPAEFVAQGKSRAVPIHVIGPEDVLAHLEQWNWTEGLVPDADMPIWPMDGFRDRFIAAFSSPHVAEVAK
ncbi:MAG: sulfatase-like protein [Pseudomonadota bacterium]